MCASPLLTRTPSFGHDEAAASVSSAYWPSPAASAVAPTLHIIAQHLPIKLLCRRLEVLTPWRHESIFTSGSERRICSRSRRLKTIDHRSIHQQRMAAPLLDARAHPNTRFDAQICNSPPTSPVNDQIDYNGHNTHNFGPPNPQQQFMGSCKQKQSTNTSVSCNNMARSVHIKSTLSYYLPT